jgi:hypothetical protein
VLTGCETTHTKTVYVPTTATPSAAVVKHTAAPQVTLAQLEAVAGPVPNGHLTDLHVAGEWALATWKGSIPQPETVLFRGTAGKWRVVRAPILGAIVASQVPGMTAAEAHALRITIVTPQPEQEERERAKLADAERRSNEVNERLERAEARQQREHEQTCRRLYREYQEGEPGGEGGEGAPRSRAAIQEYGRIGCH